MVFASQKGERNIVLDVWLYFFRHADKMDMAELPAAFHNSPPVLRALEELRMLGQTELERERYEARRKAQLDHNTALKFAHLQSAEARRQGQVEGIVMMIHLSERLLNKPQTPAEQLAGLSLAELTQLAEKLQTELAKKV